jgi:hypothetical protein
MLIRGRVPGAIAEFDFRNSAEAVRMRITPDGRVNIANRLTVGGANSSGVLDVVNPNGTYTHLGWVDNQNYFRGLNNSCDNPLILNTATSGGLPRIRSSSDFHSLIFDDGNGLQYLRNALSQSQFAPGSWNNGGGGYTLISNATGIQTTAIGFCVNAFGGSMISLTPGVAWRELIISVSYLFISNFGTLSLQSSGGNWVFISDRKTKRDIKPIKTVRSLERIMALKPVTYKKIYHEELSETPIPQEVIDKDHIGLIAQDVLECNPHCVSQWKDEKVVRDGDDGKRLAIAYQDLNIHVIGAVQELKKQNDAQQKEIDELKELVRSLILRVEKA